MVEGGILAPIFAMMMMMNVYLGGVYETKYKTVMEARFKTWSNASLNCQPEGAGESLNPNGIEAPSESQNGAGANADNGSRSGASSSWDVSHGHVVEYWDYEPTYRFNGGQKKQISSDGYTMCNSPKYGKNIFSYLWNGIKSFISGA